MKINELLNEQEQLDEIPKLMGGTGGDMPGTTSGGIAGNVGTWLKQKTGLGTGGAILKQAKQAGKIAYGQWVNIVPTLQKSGKLQANDVDGYIRYLLMFVQKRFKLTNKEALDQFVATVGMTPTKNTITRAFEQAYQNAVIQQQIGNEKQNKSNNTNNQIQPGSKVEYAGDIYRWANGAWRRGTEVLTGNDAAEATNIFKGQS